jgi:hypothetical protein
MDKAIKLVFNCVGIVGQARGLQPEWMAGGAPALQLLDGES